MDIKPYPAQRALIIGGFLGGLFIGNLLRRNGCHCRRHWPRPLPKGAQI